MSRRFCYIIFLFCFFLLGTTLFYYQIVKGDYFSSRARNNYMHVLPIVSLRGDILDRTGEKIAYDRPVFNVAVIPHHIIAKREKLFSDLSELSGCKKTTIERNYRTLMTNHFSPVNVITDIDKSDAIALMEAFPEDLIINPTPKRFYSMPYEFSHVLGYVKEANVFYDKLKKYGYKPLERVGISGIEEYYDSYLKGEDGGDLVEVNAQGSVVGYIGQRSAIKGKNIKLTLDSGIQKAAYDVLGSRRGVIILMDSSTGALLSMVSSPAYNPNYFIKGSNTGSFLLDKNAPMLNRALKSAYPLGSVFKPIIAVEALMSHIISSGTQFNCTGSFKLGRAVFKCMHVHGIQDLRQALAHSCNVYFNNVGMLMGADRITSAAYRFGFGNYTGIDYPNESKGVVPSKEWKRKNIKTAWYGGDTVNFSIGQGYFTVTPIQALIAVNAIFNGGYLVRPYFISEIGGENAEITARKYIGTDSRFLDIVKNGMWDAVNTDTGTARLLKKLGFSIAGKTGTAQTRGKAHGWFVGNIKNNGLSYSICVFLENAGSSSEAVKVCYEFLDELKRKELL